MAKVLRVFDFDDTLATTVSYIYVKHKDGTKTTLSPEEYAKYDEKPGDEYDFSDFNRMLNKPRVIKKKLQTTPTNVEEPNKEGDYPNGKKVGIPYQKVL